MLLLLLRKKCYNPTALGGYNTYSKDALLVWKDKTPCSSFGNHSTRKPLRGAEGSYDQLGPGLAGQVRFSFSVKYPGSKAHYCCKAVTILPGSAFTDSAFGPLLGHPITAHHSYAFSTIWGVNGVAALQAKKKTDTRDLRCLAYLNDGAPFRQNLMSRCSKKGRLRAWIDFSQLPKWLHLHAWVQAWVELDLQSRNPLAYAYAYTCAYAYVGLNTYLFIYYVT